MQMLVLRAVIRPSGAIVTVIQVVVDGSHITFHPTKSGSTRGRLIASLFSSNTTQSAFVRYLYRRS